MSVSVLGVIGNSALRALLLDLDVALANGPFRGQMQLTAADFPYDSDHDIILGQDWLNYLLPSTL
jgi:hypothetical protein